MAKSLQDKANKYQLNFVAQDTAPLPKSMVNFSKPAKTNWANYEVLSHFTTEAGKAVADLEASELKNGVTGKVVVSEEKTAEILEEKSAPKTTLPWLCWSQSAQSKKGGVGKTNPHFQQKWRSFSKKGARKS